MLAPWRFSMAAPRAVAVKGSNAHSALEMERIVEGIGGFDAASEWNIEGRSSGGDEPKKRNECTLEGVRGCFAFYEVYMASEESSLSYEFDGKALGTITLTATAASPM